ncbi:MAG: Response regulator PleD [Planctomycetes bacterium ADurb.Bin401]|nr:MAG: Response regulator PleD [Planctomycetes bacterium ADurb.Bin401]
MKDTKILDAITPLAQQLNCLDIQQIGKICVEQLPRLINARFVSLYILDQSSDMLHLESHNHTWLINNIVSLNQANMSPMITAVRNKELVIVKDKTIEPERYTCRFSQNYCTRTCIIAPLISNNRVVGVLNLADKINADEFSKDDIAIIELFRFLIGASIGNIKVYEKSQVLARTDGLTGLVNYRTFYEHLETELRRCQRYGGKLSAIMIDMDNLKSINDTYGHKAGDAAIKRVSTKIASCIRKIDIAARYGGDEFAIILPSTSVSEASTVADRIIKEVSGFPITWERNKISLSVSIGVGQFDGDMTPDDITKCSDSALYSAKQAGKNTFRIFELSKTGVNAN